MYEFCNICINFNPAGHSFISTNYRPGLCQSFTSRPYVLISISRYLSKPNKYGIKIFDHTEEKIISASNMKDLFVLITVQLVS